MKLPHLTSLLSPLLFLTTTLAQYSNPGECTGDCWGHDPGFQQRVSDGRYYRFSTGGGIHIHTSASLAGPWEAVGEALPGGSIVDHPGRNNLWAPDIHHSPTTNLYYMYYSVSTLGSRSSVIGVASSPSLIPGTWTDHGGLFRTLEGGPYNAIDANHITVNNQQILNFGSYWNGLHQIELENSVTLQQGASARQIAYNSTGNHAIEAAFVFYRLGWWYLTFSSGRAGDYVENRPAVGEEYRINVCRSREGTGGFVDRAGRSCLTENGGTTLLASHGNVYGPGGQGVFEDRTRGLVLYYHYADPRVGFATGDYQFGWNVLRWGADGWPSV